MCLWLIIDHLVHIRLLRNI